jgi:hypothetical protein
VANHRDRKAHFNISLLVCLALKHAPQDLALGQLIDFGIWAFIRHSYLNRQPRDPRFWKD